MIHKYETIEEEFDLIKSGEQTFICTHFMSNIEKGDVIIVFELREKDGQHTGKFLHFMVGHCDTHIFYKIISLCKFVADIGQVFEIVNEFDGIKQGTQVEVMGIDYSVYGTGPEVVYLREPERKTEIYFYSDFPERAILVKEKQVSE